MAVTAERPTLAAQARALVAAPPMWLVGILGLLIVLWRIDVNGFGGTVNMVRMSEALPDNVAPLDGEFWYWSPPGLILGRLLGIGDTQRWALMHIAVLGIGLIGVLARVRQLHGEAAASLATAALFASSVPIITLTAIGLWDPFTIVAGGALAIAAGPFGAFAAGALLGLSSFEQGVFIIATLAVLAATRQFGRLRLLGWGAAGMLVGRLAVELFVRWVGATQNRARWAADYGFDRLFESFQRGLPMLVGTVFAGAWLLIIYRVWTARPWWPWLAAVGVPFAAVTIALDQTRVMTVMTWPTLLAAAVTVGRDDSRAPALTWSLLGVALLWPAVQVWNGALHIP